MILFPPSHINSSGSYDHVFVVHIIQALEHALFGLLPRFVNLRVLRFCTKFFELYDSFVSKKSTGYLYYMGIIKFCCRCKAHILKGTLAFQISSKNILMSFNNSAANIISRRYSGFIFLKPCNLAVLYSNNGNMQHNGGLPAHQINSNLKLLLFVHTFISSTGPVPVLSPA